MRDDPPPAPAARLRPVLYLDLDDTVVAWADGHPRAAPGARAFLHWALERFEVRWLTTWCPEGRMPPNLLADLCTMVEVDSARLDALRGVAWNETESKLNGIAWVEHLVLGRPFLWIEDEYGVTDRERRVLREHGLLDRYHHCNVTVEPKALRRVHAALAAELKMPGRERERPQQNGRDRYRERER
jgi:hypothetical protein